MNTHKITFEVESHPIQMVNDPPSVETRIRQERAIMEDELRMLNEAEDQLLNRRADLRARLDLLTRIEG